MTALPPGGGQSNWNSLQISGCDTVQKGPGSATLRSTHIVAK
jgi:hypothetical protein